MKKGIGLTGGGIKNIAFTTVQACKEECAKTEGCVAFSTAAGTDNKCYLKNKDHDAESVKARSISAKMRCYEGTIARLIISVVVKDIMCSVCMYYNMYVCQFDPLLI